MCCIEYYTVGIQKKIKKAHTTKSLESFEKGTHNKDYKSTVARDTCKPVKKKQVQWALGRETTRLGCRLREEHSRAGRHCCVSGKGEGMEVNDKCRRAG